MTTAAATYKPIHRAIIAALYEADKDRRAIAAECDPLPLTIRLWPDGDITKCVDRSIPERQYYGRIPHSIDIYSRDGVNDTPRVEHAGLEWEPTDKSAEGAFEFEGEWFMFTGEWDLDNLAEQEYIKTLASDLKESIQDASEAFGDLDSFTFRELTDAEEVFAERWDLDRALGVR